MAKVVEKQQNTGKAITAKIIQTIYSEQQKTRIQNIQKKLKKKKIMIY